MKASRTRPPTNEPVFDIDRLDEIDAERNHAATKITPGEATARNARTSSSGSKANGVNPADIGCDPALASDRLHYRNTGSVASPIYHTALDRRKDLTDMESVRNCNR